MTNTHRPGLELLNKKRITQIIDEAMRTLDKVGVFVENDKALELLSGGGAKIDAGKKRAFIPPQLCEKCASTVPPVIELYNRAGEHTASVGRDNVLFDPGSAALLVYDFSEHIVRKPSTKDVIDFVMISNSMPAFKAQSTGVVPADLPEELGDRFRLFLALIYGSKPIVTGTFAKDAFATMLAFLTTVRGGKKALKDKPLAIFDCCPSPPLMWSDLTCQVLIDCALNGVPAELVSMPLTGATSPVTLAGALVQHTAEDLSGIVIHQLTNPGAPIIYGGSPACFDMRKATTPMGAVETMMIDSSYAQIGKSFGFPVHAYMGLSDSKMTDYQAGFETAMGMTLAALAGVNVVSGGGMLDFETCQSLEKLVLDNEVASMAQRLISGIVFRGGAEGFDLLKEFAESKSFLTSEHTRRFFREEAYYPSEVVDRSTLGDWEQGGSLSAGERAHKKVQKILKSAEISPPDDDALNEMINLMTSDAKKHGQGRLPDWRLF